MNHDLPSADQIKKFIWYGLGKDVASYVSASAECNQNKKSTLIRENVP